MARLTITLRDERYRALKETAARRGKTIGGLIDECLEQAGIKTTETGAEIVSRARRRASLAEPEAVSLAVTEVRAARRRR